MKQFIVGDLVEVTGYPYPSIKRGIVLATYKTPNSFNTCVIVDDNEMQYNFYHYELTLISRNENTRVQEALLELMGGF